MYRVETVRRRNWNCRYFAFCMTGVMILENENLSYMARSLVVVNGLAVGSLAGVIGSSCMLLDR